LKGILKRGSEGRKESEEERRKLQDKKKKSKQGIHVN
jgi:hypothetical protein